MRMVVATRCGRGTARTPGFDCHVRLLLNKRGGFTLHPADAAGVVGDLQPIIFAVQHAQLRAVLRGECGWGLIQWTVSHGGV